MRFFLDLIYELKQLFFMIKYELHNNGKLLIIKYIGNIPKSSLISFMKFCVENNFLSSLEEIVEDYRDTTKIYTVADLDEIIELREKIEKKLGLNKIKMVFLVNNPENTVIGTLYSDYLKGYSPVNVCSTINATLNCLSLNVYYNELERILDNPKFEYSQ